MKNIAAIVLAGGQGTRMNSAVPKVLHKICGKPMIRYMLDALDEAGIEKIVVVIGHKGQEVKKAITGINKSISVVTQSNQLGSANAALAARKKFADFNGDILVVYGDTPLVSAGSLKNLIVSCQKSDSGCAVLTAQVKNPTGYGRIARNEEGYITRIIEEQDADTYQKAILEINVGAYCFSASELFSSLKKIKPQNAKKEYYLTDVIDLLHKKRIKIEGVRAGESAEALGVNSRQGLCEIQDIMNKRNLARLVSSGVTIMDQSSTFVFGEVTAGRDTVIYPHTVLEGKIKIGCGCSIGPFARLRGGTVLADKAQVGNFVEIVRSRIGAGSKVKHHTYLGDTTIGKNVNVGAGTIVANYDGKEKHQTFIDDGAFIGTGTILIAPVKVGKKAVTGAGSVVTKNKDVPEGKVVAGVPAKIIKKSFFRRMKK